MLAREYLREHGYTKTSEALREEVGKGLERLELADNVDLGSVVREFEAYYAMRLGKPPRLTRRRANDENDLPAPPRRRKGGSTAASAPAPASANAQPAKPRAGKEREFPTSISAVFHSFRLIFGRAIISRNGLDAWMFSFRNERA